MLILGIDPGTATSGYGLIRTNGKGETSLLKFGWIETDKDGEPGTRLNEIHKGMRTLLRDFSPDVIAMERLFFYSNAKTAIRVGQAQGVFLLAAAQHKVPLFEYPPMQVKSVVSGNGRADKKIMQATIRKLFNVRSPNKKRTHFNDVADAIAVAVCHVRLAKPAYAKASAGKGGDRL